MSIKTSKTNAHQQRRSPKPLRKGGLHSIETTGAVYAHATRMRAVQTAHTARVYNSTMAGHYDGAGLAPSVRPGAMDAAALPSGGYVEQAQREAQRRSALPFVPTRKRT